jgi:hypothetical protein
LRAAIAANQIDFDLSVAKYMDMRRLVIIDKNNERKAARPINCKRPVRHDAVSNDPL